MRNLSKIAILAVLGCSFASAQTTTTITGTIRDLAQALVTSGKVTFDLRPSRDTTISGYARFSPQTVTCTITGAGLIKALDGVSVCTLTMNTALQPTGSYYAVSIWPANVKTSSFTFYAVLSTYDWSTVVPTPTTSPAQNFVDIFSNQSIGGNKTWLGTETFSGPVTFPGGLSGDITFPGNNTFTGTNIFNGLSTFAGALGTYFSSRSANPAASGVFRMASGDIACWRNSANTGDICISKNVGDQFTLPADFFIGAAGAVSTSFGPQANGLATGMELDIFGGAGTANGGDIKIAGFNANGLAPNANGGNLKLFGGAPTGSGSKGTLLSNVFFSQYNGVTLVHNGLPYEVAAVDLAAQTAAVTTATLYAVPATGAVQYRLSWNAKVTTVAGTSSQLGALTIAYTDPDGVVQTITAAAQIAAGTIATNSAGNTTTTVLLGLPMKLNCKPSTNVTYAMAYASNAANIMAYNLHITLDAE